jgi:hypothetical protein
VWDVNYACRWLEERRLVFKTVMMIGLSSVVEFNSASAMKTSPNQSSEKFSATTIRRTWNAPKKKKYLVHSR